MPLKLQCDSMASVAVFIERFVDVQSNYAVSRFFILKKKSTEEKLCPECLCG